VNDKGYLVDNDGNITDKNGKLLFPKECLLNNEFPKIFAFTKFNPKRITGDYFRDQNNQMPILKKDPKTNQLKDKSGQPVNNFGFLINPKTGDVIDDKNNLVVNKGHLDKETQNIPNVFRSGVLPENSDS